MKNKNWVINKISFNKGNVLFSNIYLIKLEKIFLTYIILFFLFKIMNHIVERYLMQQSKILAYIVYFVFVSASLIFIFYFLFDNKINNRKYNKIKLKDLFLKKVFNSISSYRYNFKIKNKQNNTKTKNIQNNKFLSKKQNKNSFKYIIKKNILNEKTKTTKYKATTEQNKATRKQNKATTKDKATTEQNQATTEQNKATTKDKATTKQNKATTKDKAKNFCSKKQEYNKSNNSNIIKKNNLSIKNIVNKYPNFLEYNKRQIYTDVALSIQSPTFNISLLLQKLIEVYGDKVNQNRMEVLFDIQEWIKQDIRIIFVKENESVKHYKIIY